MRGRWHLVFFVTAAALLGSAAACREQSVDLGAQADLMQARSAATGASFVDTFSGELVQAQLGQLDQHRSLASRASRWQQGMLFSLLGFVLSAFAGYTLRSIETLVEDASAPAIPAGAVPQRA